ncbi:UDP-N-acetylenolpyruvoylglucosamine reductase [Acidihalobacter aeolianus]|uniref:UDP-N-acetylenolpyruvoylglucosamine reductase n=1 Tax=Acidihalobacter aeolianus TaxID=2792603 RepID=A0A1D8KAD8_9GAMM|nr:UDP-N-acetylmuramate dehydrogenase [Acidihalobacter aeolianus]AOV17915.1 UDP-N-acetylenolpyruvoylglucosamine reductase [Acidihalobacter aeolianus]
MMAALRDDGLRGELVVNAPLAPLTSWRAGGCADRMYRPTDLDDLQLFLRQLPVDEPLLWLGLGSNLLVRDGGVRGTVIALHARLDGLERVGEAGVRAGAGVPGAKLARFAARAGLQGGEFFAGIPGTVGGALAMNAGAFGGETWNVVRRVRTIDRAGELRWREPSEFEIGYRHVRAAGDGDPGWFVAAEFDFVPGGDPEALHQGIRDLLANRAVSQPTGVASCGSVFRNPPGDYAGRLIEAAGLKGLRCGGAQVSEKHGNFILNTGTASAADIETLMITVQERVTQQSGIRLVPEVRIVGEAEVRA